jgi:hypothetical protein
VVMTVIHCDIPTLCLPYFMRVTAKKAVPKSRPA